MADRSVCVAVVGPAQAEPEVAALAEEVGRGLARGGAVVVCGGLAGVMEAAARGAAEAGGTVIGIVPGPSRHDANRFCTHVVAAGTGQARNLAVVASADALVAVGGGWGTLSEIALARRLDRPVVALASWGVEAPAGMDDPTGVEVAADAAEAVERSLALAAPAPGPDPAR